MHGAFQNGSKQTPWKIKKLLSHLYKFFKQAPAQRTFFTSTTGAVLFPKSFCETRCLENKAIAERAIFYGITSKEVFLSGKNFQSMISLLEKDIIL